MDFNFRIHPEYNENINDPDQDGQYMTNYDIAVMKLCKTNSIAKKNTIKLPNPRIQDSWIWSQNYVQSFVGTALGFRRFENFTSEEIHDVIIGVVLNKPNKDMLATSNNNEKKEFQHGDSGGPLIFEFRKKRVELFAHITVVLKLHRPWPLII